MQINANLLEVEGSQEVGLSTDSLGVVEAVAGIGNGSGDLIFILYDPLKGARTKTLMVDLHITEGNLLMDLTCKQLKFLKNFSFTHPSIARFVNASPAPQNIVWTVYCVLNNWESPGSPIFHDVGIVSAEKVSAENDNKMTASGIWEMRALRVAQLIEANKFGIESNGSLQIFGGEPPSFKPAIHQTLANGNYAIGRINEQLSIVKHTLLLRIEGGFSPRRSVLGHMEFRFDLKSNDSGAILIYRALE